MELDCAQLLILVPGVVTAIWAIVTFTLQWQAKQREEQKRISALYTNPFMLACQELQSRLYNILKKGGLGALNAQDRGNHSHADETIYLVAQYFGWERYMFRYSPYARDPEVFRLTEAIRDTFATDSILIPRDESSEWPEPFLFFRYQQKELGQLILQNSEGPAGWQAETISCHAFREQLDRRKDELPSVEATRKAIEKASMKSDLGNRALGRLTEVQNHLVTLLAYLEGKEEFSLFAGVRQTAPRTDDHWLAWTTKQPWSQAREAQGQASL